MRRVAAISIAVPIWTIARHAPLENPFVAPITAGISESSQGKNFCSFMVRGDTKRGFWRNTVASHAGKLSAVQGREGSNGRILTQSLLPSYHVFSHIPDNRMNIGDFYDLACFNFFNSSA